MRTAPIEMIRSRRTSRPVVSQSSATHSPSGGASYMKAKCASARWYSIQRAAHRAEPAPGRQAASRWNWWRTSALKRLTTASASFSRSRSRLLSRSVAHAAADRAARVDLGQPGLQLQRPSGSAGCRSGRSPARPAGARRPTSASSRAAVPVAVHVVAQRQAAHAVHDREDAGLLQVERLACRARRSAAGGSTSRRLRRGTSRSRRRSGRAARRRPTTSAVDLGAHAGQQRRVAGHGMRVDEDRQRHQAFGVGPQQPAAHDGGELARAAPPGRVADHDAARAVGVAEVAQRRREALRRPAATSVARRACRRAGSGRCPGRSSAAARRALRCPSRTGSCRPPAPAARPAARCARTAWRSAPAPACRSGRPACRRGTAARRSA